MRLLNPFGPRVWPSLLLGLLAALVLVPSANFAVFSGVPLTSRSTFAAALLVALAGVSRSVRKRWTNWWAARHRAGTPTRGVVALVALALAGKLLLLAVGAHTGFLACYQALPSLPSSPMERGCEHSYANPLHRFGVTRIDQQIDFGPVSPAGSASSLGQTNWNLDFFNDSRFNFYPGKAGVPDRNTLPFSAGWRGVISNDRDRPETLVARYVGEGSIVLAARSVSLGASYGGSAVRAFTVPPGTHRLDVQYEFAKQTIQPATLAGPYAAMSIRLSDGTALQSAPPAIQWRIVASFADGVTAALLLVAAWVLLTVLRGAAFLAIVVGGIAAIVLHVSPAQGRLARSRGHGREPLPLRAMDGAPAAPTA